jgi:RNA polymerase sigma-70 factor (ECF subfamily)
MPTAMASLDDTALVQMTLAGHGERFGELINRHNKVVRARVRSILRNSPDVDDVVQDVFFKAWRALPTFRAEASVRTWLTSIATNEALMFLRREQRRRRYETSDEYDTVAWHGEPADQRVIRGEDARIIRGAIRKLPAIYRDVVMLRDIEELTAPITAERLKSTLPAVKTRHSRGRLRLAVVLRGSPAKASPRAA